MKKRLTKILAFIFNPHLLLCFGIAWMITNGWAYTVLGLGIIFGSEVMIALSGGYLAFLWLPFTPEKLITIPLAIYLLKLIFPKDKATLAVLTEMLDKIKKKFKEDKNERARKRNSRRKH